MKYRLEQEKQILKRLEELMSVKNIEWEEVKKLSFVLDKIIAEKTSIKKQ